MAEDQTEFEDPGEEERIVNLDKIYDLVNFYKIPLIFSVLAIFLLGGALILWRVNNQGGEGIIFSEEATISGTLKIKTDIEGAVVRPGVYELVSGSRIADLLIMAGGLSEGADRQWVARSLNQAAKLVDGAKIYIPTVTQQNSQNTTNTTNTTNKQSFSANTTNAQISINSATLSQLDTLPGVGPVTAQKIIDNRPYQTLEELVSKKAVGQSVFEKIKDKISLY